MFSAAVLVATPFALAGASAATRRWPLLAWIWSLEGALLTALVAVMMQTGSHPAGTDWFGLDSVGRAVVVLGALCTGGLVAVAWALGYPARFASYALVPLGMLAAVMVAHNQVLAVLLLELAGLSLVPGMLAGWGRRGLGERAPVVVASLRYLTTLCLAGIFLVLSVVFYERFLLDPSREMLFRVAVTAAVVGFGLALAVVPFHLWIPTVAEHTSPLVVGLLATVIGLSAFGLLLRVALDVNGLGDFNPGFRQLLVAGAGAGALIGAVLASAESRLRRYATYVMSSHLGLALMGVAAGTDLGIRASVLQGTAHVLGLLLLCLSLALLMHLAAGVPEWKLHGLGRRAPAAGAAFVAAALTLVGLPPFPGFAGTYLVMQAVAEISPWLAVLPLAASLVLALSLVRVGTHLFRGESTLSEDRPEPPAARVVIAATIAGSVAVGFVPHLVLLATVGGPRG